MHRTFTILALFLLSALAGCTTSPPVQDPVQGQTPPEEVVPWHLQAQRSIGYYIAVGAPAASTWRLHPDYCRGLTFVVPDGSTRLDLNFTSTPANASSGSAGLLGFFALSESETQRGIYPGVTNPQGFLDNPKRLSFDSPEAGTWRLNTYTQGVAVQQLGNLTIDVHGTSAEAPQELGIQMTC